MSVISNKRLEDAGHNQGDIADLIPIVLSGAQVANGSGTPLEVWEWDAPLPGKIMDIQVYGAGGGGGDTRVDLQIEGTTALSSTITPSNATTVSGTLAAANTFDAGDALTALVTTNNDTWDDWHIVILLAVEARVYA